MVTASWNGATCICCQSQNVKSVVSCFQPGVVGQMLEAAEERPWLWVVYVLTVALPVFLVILFCCSGKVWGLVCCFESLLEL